MAKILVLKSGDELTNGAIIGVFGDDHIFGKMESMQRFFETGGSPEDWPDRFYNLQIKGESSEALSHLSICGDHGSINFIDFDLLPEGVKGEIVMFGESVISIESLESAIVNRS